MVFREEFLKAKFGVRAAGCVTFFWLVGGEVTGWYSRNLVLSLVTILHLGGGLSSYRRTQRCIVIYTTWGGTRTMLYCCTIVSWLLFPCVSISSLPRIITLWICPLELRESLGGWSYFPTNKELGIWRSFCTREGATVYCLVSVFLTLFFLCFLSLYPYLLFIFFFLIKLTAAKISFKNPFLMPLGCHLSLPYISSLSGSSIYLFFMLAMSVFLVETVCLLRTNIMSYRFFFKFHHLA